MSCFARSCNLSNTMTTLRDGLLGLFVLFLGVFPAGAQEVVLRTSAFSGGGGEGGDGTHRVQGTLGAIANPAVLGTEDVLHGVGFWFALRSTEIVLPVELTAFAAQVDGEAVILTWSTASETNNAGFAVEQHRATDDTWQSVGFVKGVGTTNESQRYRFRVTEPGLGVHRFRLQQVDLDGATAYSDEVAVRVLLAEPFRISSIYPNPSVGRATVDVAVRATQRVRADLYDLLGRRVAVIHDGVLGANQTTRLTVDGRELPSAMYLLRIMGDDFVITRRLTIVR